MQEVFHINIDDNIHKYQSMSDRIFYRFIDYFLEQQRQQEKGTLEEKDRFFFPIDYYQEISKLDDDFFQNDTNFQNFFEKYRK